MTQSNLLTASRFATFQFCPQKHDYEYLQGYRALAVPEALAFGTLWHNCQEAGFNEAKEIQHRSPDRVDERVYFLFGSAASAAIPRETDPFIRARLRAGLRLQFAVFSQSRFLHTHEVLAVEKAFIFPHVNPATGKPSPLWLRAGKIDVIVRHIPTKRIRVIEHKSSSSNIDVDSMYWQTLSLDNQISQYVLGAEVLNPGMVVDEVLYDVLRKSSLRPYRVSKKRAVAETPAEFEDRLVAKSSPASFYRMHLIPRTERQIVEHLKDTWALSQMIRVARNEGMHPRNTASCHALGRGTCAFLPICLGQRRLDDARYYQHLDDPHPELKETVGTAEYAPSKPRRK